ncbi:MAG TPA: SDR family oxidoreductase [Gemmatimonadales bacterium]|nr:SDR family oxidoreductase [Gemmatimonadales bacterium]
MSIRLKPIREQVLVITGASSGIGLATARAAVREGARVFLTSRNDEALARIAADLNAVTREPRAGHLAADVADPEALERVAQGAVDRFGGIDTWVNNAGVSLYGRLLELSIEDQRRLFDVTFWGVVYGCRAAVPRLGRRGGALINVGSIASDRAIPLQGIYSAAKHAVKAFTDALRMELEEAGTPVAVTLIKPSSINTPVFEHAQTELNREPAPPPPVYQPEVVAETILRCAEEPVRDVTVGAGGKLLTALGGAAPRLLDRYMERTLFRQQRSSRPVSPNRVSNLTEVPRDGRVHGLWPGPVHERSAYTEAALRPGRAALAALGVGLAVLAGITLLGERD